MRVKRLHPSSFLTEEKIRAAYKVYRDSEVSTYDLGRMLYEQLGYKNPENCATAIYKAFQSRGYEMRSRSESRKLALKRRGFAVGKEARHEKRRERYLRERGQTEHQPRCATSTKRGPCKHPAAIGSNLCAWHRGVVPEKRCPATNVHGEQCRLPRQKNGEYCNKHAHLEAVAA